MTTLVSNLMFIGPCIIGNNWRMKDQLDVTCYFISLIMCSTCLDINISIIRSLLLCWWIITSVVLFSVRCVLEIWCGWFWVVFVLQAEAQLLQPVSDINISIFRSLRLCCWITTSVVLFSVRCVLKICCGWFWVVLVLQAEAQQVVFRPAKRTPPKTARNKSSNTQRTENKTTDVIIQQHSRKLLKTDILMSETCWAHNKWNKIASGIKLVFHSPISGMSTKFWSRIVCLAVWYQRLLRLKSAEV